MKRIILISILFISQICAYGQNNSSKIKTKGGSFSINVAGQQLTEDSVINLLNDWFQLNDNHSFVLPDENMLRSGKSVHLKIERTDKLGFKHSSLQQTYKNVPVENQIVMFHSKNDSLKSMNGQIAEFEDLDMQINISDKAAVEIAKKHLNVKKLAKEYPVETVIAKIPSKDSTFFKLTKKVKIISQSPFLMFNVYVDAQTGEVLNKISLIRNADVNVAAQTLYSGMQNITCDTYQKKYRLRDNARNIKTFDGSSLYWWSGDREEVDDYVNDTAEWDRIPKLSSFRISEINITGIQAPCIYIQLKDKSDSILYGGPGTRFNRINPPLSFNDINIFLNNPPYSVEIWNYNNVGDDHLIDSITISTQIGIQSWSDNGNGGAYIIDPEVNPALDVHGGLEKAYDFYKEKFDRNSFDDKGSEIIGIVGVSDAENNAYAVDSEDNPHMAFGFSGFDFWTGLQYSYNPFVDIDIVGHEFAHLVVSRNGNGGLVYQVESGALNESFADIFGTCVEFFADVDANWTNGEKVKRHSPYYIRSLSNPSDHGLQPDTYRGEYWDIYEEVHTNSGVQNYWFYLLCNGGSGTNDLKKEYHVEGIGMDDAMQIAYRNLIYYLTPEATYEDAYNGSLQAVTDLFGESSVQYNAVKDAWCAVGIGKECSNYCFGLSLLTENSGTISDGSGSENYGNDSDCAWRIETNYSNQITLTFTSFDTEEGADSVYIYDGWNEYYPLLGAFSGSSLPQSVTTSGGNGMFIKFITNDSVTKSGWSADYYVTDADSLGCNIISILHEPEGSFSDGSDEFYYNNRHCTWVIAPPNAKSIVLSFTEFDLETDYDFVYVYDDLSGNNSLASFTGNKLPQDVVSTTGVMMVVFSTDEAIVKQGFTIDYTSTTTNDVNEIARNTNIKLYPNPTDNVFTIESDLDVVVQFFDVVGKQVINDMNLTRGIHQVDISNLSKGVYLLRFISEGDNSYFVERIIKK